MIPTGILFIYNLWQKAVGERGICNVYKTKANKDVQTNKYVTATVGKTQKNSSVHVRTPV